MRETKKRLHLCVGFYLNGDYKVNAVRDEDLEDNIKYNATYRPGRFYFVDGEHVCGGLLVPDAQAAFVQKCKDRLHKLNLPEPTRDSRPYQ